MNDEYEEFPCPDTNTFRVGDLVRVYYGVHVYTVKVALVQGDQLHLDNASIANYKACRPLKKKEPPKIREFWIADYNQDNRPLRVYELKHHALVTSAAEIIAVQDRCDSCGKDFNK